MSVNYNNFAKTFSNSRKNMKWEEIDYFIEKYLKNKKNLKILDIGCGNGRFLSFLKENNIEFEEYLGVDLSENLLEEASFLHKQKINLTPPPLGTPLKNGRNIVKFLHLNMLDLDKIKEKFNHIFFIASFHHLENLKDREEVFNKTYNLLEKSSKIFLTNWALNSELNEEKYKNSKIKNSKNQFGNIDYKIKIGNFDRFYHCFSLEELEFLAKKSGFKIIENKLFSNKKNFITILEK